MHEYSLVTALLARVDEEARARQATGVRKVRLSVGELSGVEAELLGWAFEVARENTLCGQAELELDRVAARWECPDCQKPVPPGGALHCPGCGAPAQLVAGHELILERIELEVPD